MTEKIYSYEEVKTKLAKVPDDHDICYFKSPKGVRFYVEVYKSDNHYKPYLKLEVNQVTWMMLRINDVKLPKIPIDQGQADSGKYPFDGSWILGHENDDSIMAIQLMLDDDYLYWIDRGGCAHDLGDFTHYTPMPQFEEVKGGDV